MLKRYRWKYIGVKGHGICNLTSSGSNALYIQIYTYVYTYIHVYI